MSKKQKKAGRPKDPGAKRAMINVRMTDEEKQLLAVAADTDGRPLAQWARLTLIRAASK